MFVELQALLKQKCISAQVLVSTAGDTMTVAVIPEAAEKCVVALALPFVLTKSAAELDATFVAEFTAWCNTRGELVDQLEATKTIMEAARKESAAKALKPAEKGTAAKPAVKSAAKPAAPAKSAASAKSGKSTKGADAASRIGNDLDGEASGDGITEVDLDGGVEGNGDDASASNPAPVAPAAEADIDLFS